MSETRPRSWLHRNGWWVVLVVVLYIGIQLVPVTKATWPAWWLSLEQRLIPVSQTVPKGGQLYGPFGPASSYRGLALFTPNGSHSVAVVASDGGSVAWLSDGKLVETTGYSLAPSLAIAGHRAGPEWGTEGQSGLWVSAGSLWYEGKLHSLGRPQGGSGGLRYGEPHFYMAGPEGQVVARLQAGHLTVFDYDGRFSPLAAVMGVQACWDRAANRPLIGFRGEYDEGYLWDGTTTQGPFAELAGPNASLTGTPRIAYMVREQEDGPVWLVDQGRKVERFDELGEPTLSDDGKHLQLLFNSKRGARVWYDGKWLGPFQKVSSLGRCPGTGHLAFEASTGQPLRNAIYLDGKEVGQGEGPMGPLWPQAFLPNGKLVWLDRPKQGEIRVHVGTEQWGPYKYVGWVAPAGELGDVWYWADLQGETPQSLKGFYVDGRKLIDAEPRRTPNAAQRIEDRTNYKPVRGAEGQANATPVVCMNGEGQYVLVNGKPVGPFGWVDFVREESIKGPITAFCKKDNSSLRQMREYLLQDNGIEDQRPGKIAPNQVWVDGQTYSLRQYKRLAKAGGFPTSYHDARDKGGYLWVGGEKLGPFENLYDYAISPDGKQLLLAFSYRGQAYLWQGPVTQ